MDRKKEAQLIAKVAEINKERMSEGKSRVPTSLEEIRPFPVRDYDALIAGVRDGYLKVHRVFGSRNSFVFDAVKSFVDTLNFWFGIALAIASPVAAVFLAVWVSWWWMLLALCVFFGMGIVARTYDRAVFRAAFSSESAFCYLYWVRAINVFDSVRDKFFERQFEIENAPEPESQK